MKIPPVMNITRHLAALRNRGYLVRAAIVGLVAAILVPGLLLGGWLMFTSATVHREQLEYDAAREAREATAMIDREMASARNILMVLADSHFLQTGKFEEFHELAANVFRNFNAHIVLREVASGRHIVNTYFPLGSALPTDMPLERREAEDQVLESGQPMVSNMFMARIRKELIVAMVVPVLRDGVHAYTLGISIPVEKFTHMLERQQNPPEWIVSIIDRSGTIIARSARHKEYVGLKARIEQRLLDPNVAGVHRGIDQHGVPFFWSWRKSEIAGWAISVGIPEAVLNAPVRRAMTAYSAAAGTLFIAAVALSFFAGGRISQSIGVLGVDRKLTGKEATALFESAFNGVLIVDDSRNVVLANAQIERLFGYQRDELVGLPAKALFSEPLDFVASQSLFETVNGRPLFGCRKDGSRFPIEIGLNLLAIDASNLVRAVVIDTSPRKLAEERLAAAIAERDELRRRLMQAQEEERLRLARELHDQTAQSLVAAMLELKAMEPLLAEGGRERLRALETQLQKLGKTLHRVAWELRPASIDELGLAIALDDYVAEWSAQVGIEAEFHCGESRLDALDDDIRTTIYRLVQEGLTNIAKHAPEASTVSVVIDGTNNVLRLTIEDDGRGFYPAAGRGNAGLGIAGMRERLALIGGTLEVESGPGQGTTIYSRIPIERERLAA
jgi:two-component system, NarL family, sensor histidine kinase UhpB